MNKEVIRFKEGSETNRIAQVWKRLECLEPFSSICTWIVLIKRGLVQFTELHLLQQMVNALFRLDALDSFEITRFQ